MTLVATRTKERDMSGNRQMIPMLALVAAGLLGAGVAVAQMTEGEHPGSIRGFQRLHKELKLNPQQEEMWKKAEELQHDAFKTARAKGAETRAKLRVEIDKPGVDLKKFAEMRDQLGEQMRAQMDASRKQVRAAWFGLYDSLDAKQREQVRVAIRDGMDRMGRHGGRPHGGMQGEHLGATPGTPAPGKAG
jgi:protein CpxP